jgi:hypothetical protein
MPTMALGLRHSFRSSRTLDPVKILNHRLQKMRPVEPETAFSVVKKYMTILQSLSFVLVLLWAYTPVPPEIQRRRRYLNSFRIRVIVFVIQHLIMQ